MLGSTCKGIFGESIESGGRLRDMQGWRKRETNLFTNSTSNFHVCRFYLDEMNFHDCSAIATQDRLVCLVTTVLSI